MQCVSELEELLAAIPQSGECPDCVTPANAVGYLGAGYLKAMLDEAERQRPGQQIVLWCDCADSPGLVMGALREGLRHLVIDTDEVCYQKLNDIAAQQGAVVRKVALQFD